MKHPAKGDGDRLCRNCVHWSHSNQSSEEIGQLWRCPNCGQPDYIEHPEAQALNIAHIDCDAFYAAVEKRDNPELVDRPLIVGGKTRGVVTTACYLARIKGVRSAMPMFKARKLCPEAAIVKPNFPRYQTVGRAVRKRFEGLTTMVQPLSIDEAFLDFNGAIDQRTSPLEQLVRLANAIEHDYGITISIGLSHNKLMAKIASDRRKPKGLFILGKTETADFLEDQPVSILWGVGQALEKRLAKKGVTKVGELRRFTEEELVRSHGSMGSVLYRFCRGEDKRRVQTSRGTKSVSSETTFSTDLSDEASLVEKAENLSTRVADRLVRHGLSGLSVTLKLKTHDHRLLTRSQSIQSPTCSAERIFAIARELLVKNLHHGPFRLIGVGVHNLADIDAADPFDLAAPLSETS